MGTVIHFGFILEEKQEKEEESLQQTWYQKKKGFLKNTKIRFILVTPLNIIDST